MDKEQQQPLDLTEIRARLSQAKGPQFWRSLEEVADTPAFQQFVEDEFPNRESLLQLDRRQFLTVMGASLAMAGLAGCRKMPQEKIVPYVKAPEQIIPGRPLAFATAAQVGGEVLGLLVESHEGRPTKVEGNPSHPASLGKTNAFAQASVLDLYNPDRSQTVKFVGEISSWDAFLKELRERLGAQAATGGAGLRILTESVVSPTLAEQITRLLARYPAARWHQYDAAGHEAVRQGAELAFGRNVNSVYRFDRADRVLSLDADFLLRMPGSVRYALDFADRRRVRADQTEMNRLYVVESAATTTGAMADHRLPVNPSQVEAVARAVAARVGVAGAVNADVPGVDAAWLDALARDLQAYRGRSLVVAGEHCTPAVHVLAHAINGALGNNGQTVLFTAPVEAGPGASAASLRALTEDMNAGRVDTLLILGGNPVYSAPADVAFAQALTASNGDRENVPFRAHLGMFENETSAVCHWHLPEAHYLESWGDIRSFDGTTSIVQPLIAPLYEGRSCLEMVSLLAGQGRTGYDLVRDYWRRQRPGGNFDAWWERTLNDGVIANSAPAAVAVAVRPGAVAALPAAAAAANGYEIAFLPDPTIWDGRYADNAWLQELPKPMTNLVWDNAVLVSPHVAEQEKLTNGDMVRLKFTGRELLAAIWVQPGQPQNTLTLHLGYGRTKAGKIGSDNGFNANVLRTSDALSAGRGVTLEKTGGQYKLVSTQLHHSLDASIHKMGEHTSAESPEISAADAQIDTQHERNIVQVHTIAQFRADREKDKGESAHHGDDTHADDKHSAKRIPGGAHDEKSTAAEYGSEDHAPLLGRREWTYNQGEPEQLGHHPSVFPEYAYNDYEKWAMTIDLNTCIGCNACTIACQAENNIAVVGKEQVAVGREMHWIRIDRYYQGDLENPNAYFQPIPCMHCEKAPCEPVCPVAATVHSHEGLNMMVYNRCVGTRYCSNNCPYKVRRFNFLKYTAGSAGPKTNNYELPVLKMVNNPDVTVRGRGVMEKCTYCVQRINQARIQAKNENRPIRDGEVVPACAQACPTETIIFGDLNDKTSRILRSKQQPHNYDLLDDLNTQPRTSFLARLRNPNPDIEPAQPLKAGGASNGH